MAILIGSASSSSAVLVTNEVGTILFYDNFENVAVGGAPSAIVGTWIDAGATANRVVSNAVPPGAAQGYQYLKLWRVGQNTAQAADFGAISSGNLSLSFSLFIPTDAPNDVASMIMSDTLLGGVAGYPSSKVWLTVTPATDNKVYYNNAAITPVDTGITYQKGVWQTWQIDYTFLPGGNNDLWTITVGESTSAPLHGGPGQSEAVASLRYLTFYTGANNSEFFVDAVPEPSTVGLMAVGLLGLLRMHGAKRH